MKFMMLMIPAAYQGGKTSPDFRPERKDMEAMGRFNEEMGKALKIESPQRPASAGQGRARVVLAKCKPTVTDGPFIETKKKCWAATGWSKRRRRKKW